jgi:hypothetical protein
MEVWGPIVKRPGRNSPQAPARKKPDASIRIVWICHQSSIDPTQFQPFDIPELSEFMKRLSLSDYSRSLTPKSSISLADFVASNHQGKERCGKTDLASIFSLNYIISYAYRKRRVANPELCSAFSTTM